MPAFAIFAMIWATLVGIFALALLLGYRLPIGRAPRGPASRPVQALTLLDSTSIDV